MNKIDGYYIGSMKLRMLEEIHCIPSPDSHPDLKAHAVLNSNPLYCGTALLNLRLAIEDVGLMLANHHVSIVLTAQLYNALKQKNLVQGVWPEMEVVIRDHMSAIFFSSLPHTAKQIYMRFALRGGRSMTEYSTIKHKKKSP